MNIQVLINVNALPEHIQTMIKALGKDCYDTVSKWNKENGNIPIENPIEKFLYFSKAKYLYDDLIGEGYKSIADAYMVEMAEDAGCEFAYLYQFFHSTREAANQSGSGYEKAKKWAAKNNVRKITVGNISMYRWTNENINDFCEEMRCN